MTEPAATDPPGQGSTFDDLLVVARRLLGPGGCEWDRAQTPQSLLPYLIEEAYEVREAVLASDDGELAGELGDLALHVAFQSLLAEERGAFTPADIFRSIVGKMVRRHPQVFGSWHEARPGAKGEAEEAVAAPKVSSAPPASFPSPASPPSPAQPASLLALPWEEMKRRERAAGAGGRGRALDGVPAALPALLRAQRIQERAAGVGFDWPDARGPLSKVREELGEVELHLANSSLDPEPPAAPNKSDLQEEIGDLLFAVVNLARRSGVSAEQALDLATGKFKRRFELVEDLAHQRGLDVAAAGLERLDALWDEVKLEESGAVGREGRSV